MADNRRKRCRKDALVVRACYEYSDEKVRNVQDAQIMDIKKEIIEMETAEPSDDINYALDVSHIKKEHIDEEPHTSPPLFGVNVEVEEYKEDQNMYIITESTSRDDMPCTAVQEAASSHEQLMASASPNSADPGEPIKTVPIDLDKMYEEVDKISRTSDNIADALLSIELRNYWGTVLRVPLEDDPRDLRLQEAIQIWKSWHNNSKYRDVPLFYKCYICEMSWWNLDPFRTHLLCHDLESYRIEVEDSPHECNIMAYGTVNIPSPKDIPTDGECWRCNKPFDFHTAAKKQSGFYYCKCCEEKFYTCTDLKNHEGRCWQYLKYLEVEKGHRMIMCNLCKCLLVSKNDMAKHMSSRHMVRSDVPVPPQYRVCTKCNRKYFIYALHYCPKKTMNYNCTDCFKSFLSKVTVDLHTTYTKSNVKCKICNIKIRKKCMEMMHYKKHSDSYVMAYKCSTCTNLEVYLDLKSAGDHRWVVHKQKNDKRRHYFENVLLPRSYLGTDSVIREEIMPAETAKGLPNGYIAEELRLEVNKAAVQKTYQNKAPSQKLANQDIESRTAVTQIKQEAVDLDEDMINISQQLMGNANETQIQVIEAPEYSIQMHIKTEPIDDEFEEDIIRLSMDHLPNNVIKEEPQETYIKTEPQDNVETYITDLEEEVTELPDDFVIKEELEYVEDDEDNNTSVDSNVEPMMMVTVGYKKPPNIYTCSKCGYRNVHRKYKEHMLANCQLKAEEKDENKRIYSCLKCSKTITSFKKYLLHFSKHGYPSLSCPVCVKPFENMSRLLMHVMLHIKQCYVRVYVIDRSQPSKPTRKDSKFQCKYCKVKVEYANFTSHWVDHSNLWSKKDVLQKKVNEKEVEYVPLEIEGLKLVLAYLQTDSAELKVKDCVLCERHFDRKNDCKRHLIEHLLTDAYHNKPKYGGLRCQICAETYQKPDHYKLHMRDHGSLPVYRCDICVRTFSDSSNFTKHKKVHNIEVLVCDICTKKFQAKASLVKHLEIHSVTEPINCDLCSRVYYTESSYKKHKRVYHEKSITKFKCYICRQRFVTLKDKWDHLWLVHQERKMKADCPICKKGFRKIRDVNAHMKQEHTQVIKSNVAKNNEYEMYLNGDHVELGQMETLIVFE